jgi:predicted anti-sigma-YlaC factor YlaD
MNHKEIQLLVSSFLDGEIKEDDKAKVQMHIEACSECRRFTEQAQQMREHICALGEAKLPYAFSARVAQVVEKRDKQMEEWLGVEPLARNTVFAIAVVVLMMFIFTSFQNGVSSLSADQLLSGIISDSTGTQVLLQQDELSKNDLLYAVVTK